MKRKGEKKKYERKIENKYIIQKKREQKERNKIITVVKVPSSPPQSPCVHS